MFKNLAKPDETIIQHTQSCLNVAHELCKFLSDEISGILDTEYMSGKDLLILATAFHDFGKYAQPFQNKTLNPEYNDVWGYRHEIFSAEFVDLIDDISIEEKILLKLVILSHHNKTINQLEKATFNYNLIGSPIIGLPVKIINAMNNNRKDAYCEGKESIVKYSEKIINEIKNISSNLNIKINGNIKKLSNVFDIILSYYKSVNSFENDFNYKKIAFLKGLLVTSDHLGSGHQEILSVDKNIKNYYCNMLNIPAKGKFQSIQIQCIESKGRSSVLRAPTGSGKTEAAFLWVNENLKMNKFSRIFYILPYTASINAMFKRINNCEFAREKVDILHGKNTAYFYELLTKDKNESEINETIDTINSELRMKKFTAKSIAKPIKICTPHQIIKNFYGLKHFEESFIQYYNGLFIFDEIHCYDKVLLSELICTMFYVNKNFSGKFLFMSATFPTIIENLIREYIGINSKTICFSNPELENFTRTQLFLKNGLIEEIDNILLIQKKLNDNKKVLVVCNTIKKAQKIFDKLDCNHKILLHSGFNTNDRKIIENKILSDKKNQLLVGTQAIEVSLDLDYDCCFSEIASFDSLIQRFGRVYRNRKRNDNVFGNVFVFKEADNATKLIYNEKINDQRFDIVEKSLFELEKLNGQSLDFVSITKSIDNIFSAEYENEIRKIIEDNLKKLDNETLIPMRDYSTETKIYFDQFDGIKVLPEEYKKLYIKYIQNKRYIDADNLLVTLSERKLFHYYRQNLVFQDKNYGKNIFVTDSSFIEYTNSKGLFLLENMQGVIL
ncbi:MAG: CRISPR-associated helicase Cas3' [bacterium]